MVENYRHEYKYLLSEKSLREIENRIKGIMKRDAHAGKDGKYLIRSIYFDDVYDSCFRENEDGAEIKEKFRIRAYNADSSFISLELKRKEHGKTRKLSETISMDVYRQLVYNEPVRDFEALKLLSRRLFLQMKTRLMKPKIIVQYEREPFIYSDGNVRVTFDRYIAASTHIDRMFEANGFCLPSLPKDIQLLEVKWDAFLPEHISAALENENLQSTTFSKYYMGRISQPAGHSVRLMQREGKLS